MKNAMLLLGIWVGIILAAYGMVYWGGAPATSADTLTRELLYVDEEGTFQVPVPIGWWTEETDNGVVLHDPLQEITVRVAASDRLGAFQVLGETWTAVAPCCSPTFRIIEALVENASGWKARISIECSDPSVPQQAVVHMTSGGTATLLVRYEAVAPNDRRGTDLETIVQGFTNLQ